MMLSSLTCEETDPNRHEDGDGDGQRRCAPFDSNSSRWLRSMLKSVVRESNSCLMISNDSLRRA